MDNYEWLMFGVALASFVLSVISTVINTTRKKNRIREKNDRYDEEEGIIE